MSRRGLPPARLASGRPRRRERRNRRTGGAPRRPAALPSLRRRQKRRTPLHGARRLPSLALPLRRTPADLQTGTATLFRPPPPQSASRTCAPRPCPVMPLPERFALEHVTLNRSSGEKAPLISAVDARSFLRRNGHGLRSSFGRDRRARGGLPPTRFFSGDAGRGHSPAKREWKNSVFSAEQQSVWFETQRGSTGKNAPRGERIPAPARQ